MLSVCIYRLIRFPNGRQVVCDPPVDLPVEHDERQDRREEEVKAGHGRKSPQDAEQEAADALHRHREQDVVMSLECSVAEMGLGRFKCYFTHILKVFA